MEGQSLTSRSAVGFILRCRFAGLGGPLLLCAATIELLNHQSKVKSFQEAIGAANKALKLQYIM